MKRQKREAKNVEATPVQDSGSLILVLLFQCKWKTTKSSEFALIWLRTATITHIILQLLHWQWHTTVSQSMNKPLEKPSVHLTWTWTAWGKHISIGKKSCKAKQSYIFISAFAWVFLQPICATAICATLNNGQKRSIKLRNFTPSPDLNGCQFYCWISVIIFVWDNKVKVFLREIYCNQFQRFDCNRGQSEFHRFFTRHSQSPYSSLQRSQISSVKNNKYTNTYMSLRMVKWHLSDIYLY